jgi:hypothetical protein
MSNVDYNIQIDKAGHYCARAKTVPGSSLTDSKTLDALFAIVAVILTFSLLTR